MDALDAFVMLAALQTEQALGGKRIDDVVDRLAWQQCIRADLALRGAVCACSMTSARGGSNSVGWL
jgi:hypothetical protein